MFLYNMVLKLKWLIYLKLLLYSQQHIRKNIDGLCSDTLQATLKEKCIV